MKRKPTSPGEILFEEFLKPLELTQKELAEHLGCDYKVINRIVNERASVTPEIAIKLAAAFETTPDFWLNAQMAVDLWSLRTQKPKIRPLTRTRRKTQQSFL
ncbi:MAG: HigA family addiction module antitoxin [Chlamydiota bacterium]